jgi:hypothetical protein
VFSGLLQDSVAKVHTTFSVYRKLFQKKFDQKRMLANFLKMLYRKPRAAV